MLVRRLNRDGARFDFAAFVAESGIDPERAAKLAESVFVRFYAGVIGDGEITDRERRQLQKLAKRLDIGEARRAVIERKVAKRAYRERLREAQADGVITPAELEELRQLKSALELAPAKPQPSAAVAVPVFDEQIRDSADKREPDKQEHAEIIARVEASSRFAGRNSAERLARVPAWSQPRRIPVAGLTLWLVTFGIMLAVFGFLMASRGVDVRFVYGIGGVVLGLVGIVIPGLMLLPAWLSYRRFKASPVESRAVVVVGKRTDDDSQAVRATFRDKHGRESEHTLRDRKLFERLTVGDAGVLFLRRDRAFDFDCVLTAEAIREEHIRGAVKCPVCATVYRLERVPANCVNCGADLQTVRAQPETGIEREDVYSVMPWMERWSEGIWTRKGMIHEVGGPSLKRRVEGRVICGWCRTPYETRPETPACRECGGPLPMPPGNDPGPKPSHPPRVLPRSFASNVFLWKNTNLKYAVILLALSLTCCLPAFPILFPCGFLGVIYSLVVARRQYLAYSRGVAVLGKYERVQRISNEPEPQPELTETYRVFFRFEPDGQPVRGMFYTYDSSIANHFAGEPVWVVYLPQKPHVCATWPPFG